MFGNTMQANNFQKNICKLDYVFNLSSLVLLSVTAFIFFSNMVAPQEDANCYEDVVLEIQNMTDLNQFALAYENKLQIETKESQRSAREGRQAFFLLYIIVSLFLHLCIHVNSVHIHIFATCFSQLCTHLNSVNSILYLWRKVQWLTFPWCTLLCGFISAINKLHKLKVMASCSLLYLIICIYL